MMAAAVANMLVSVSLGAVSDHLHDRRPMILAATAVGMIGFALFFMMPSVTLLIFVLLVVTPIAGSTFPLLFASVRAVTHALSLSDAAAVNSAVRVFFSLAFAIVPGLVGLFLATRAQMTDAWAISSLGMLFCFLLYMVFGSKSPVQVGVRERTSFGETLGALGAPLVVSSVLACAILGAPQSMNMTILPLILINKLGGTPANVGLVAGGLAVLEIPFLLVWGAVQQRRGNRVTLVSGGLIYCLYLAALAFATERWHVYALTLPNAAGSAALLSAPMSYLQNLLPKRPGLGTSLITLSMFASAMLNAATFALGTMVTDYAGIAGIGAAITLLGCGLIWRLRGE